MLIFHNNNSMSLRSLMIWIIISIILMKEVLKIINECVFSTRRNKKERLVKLSNIRKILYSEYEWHHDININLFEIIDDISLKIIDRANYDGNDSPLKLDNSEYIEFEIVDKFNELLNSILNI